MRDATKLNSLEAGALLDVLKRGQRTILIWMGLFALLGVTLNTLLPPVYRATVRLEIRKPPDRSPLTGQSLASASYQSENVSMITAAERIKDRMLLGAIATEFSPQGWIRSLPTSLSGQEGLAARLQWAPAASAKPVTPAGNSSYQSSVLASQVDWLQTIVAVEPIQDTRLVDLKVEHRDPLAAKTIADRLAQRYVDDQCRQAADADTNGLVYLSAQLTGMKKNLAAGNGDASSSRLEGPAVLQARIRALGDAAVALNSEYLKARSDRIELKTRLDRIAMSDPAAVDAPGATPAEDGALASLQRDMENCRVQLASAREIYKAKHPRLIGLESQYAALQAAFRAEQQRAIARLKDEAALLQQRENSASAARLQNDQALSEAERQFELASSAHSEFKAQQDLYGLLVTKIQQSRVEEMLKSRPVEIVNAANVSPHPVRPRKVLNLVVCLVTGLLFGSGQTLIRSSGRNTVRTARDVEVLLDLPLLGVIPKRD